MKYCPACNFSFPDFHHVCDFDGTELVSEPERQALMKVRPSRLQSALKSPAFLSVMLAIVLLSSAITIGYLETRSARMTSDQAAANAPGDVSQVATGGEQSPRKSRRLAHSFHNHKRNLRLSPSLASIRRETVTTRALAKRHQKFTVSPTATTETARSREPQQTSNSSAMNAPAATRASQTPARIGAPGNSEFAASRSFEPVTHQKEPKLTAMLKTTWHVLKKPFKF